jgi:hypothetical protein
MGIHRQKKAQGKKVNSETRKTGRTSALKERERERKAPQKRGVFFMSKIIYSCKKLFSAENSKMFAKIHIFFY